MAKDSAAPPPQRVLIEFSAGVAQAGQLPAFSYKSGEPTWNLVARKALVSSNAMANAFGVASAAAFGVGFWRFTYVRLQVPMTKREQHIEEARLVACFVVMMFVGCLIPIFFIAFGAGHKQQLLVLLGLLIGALGWTGAFFLAAPMRAFKYRRRGVVAVWADPVFAEAVRRGLRRPTGMHSQPPPELPPIAVPNYGPSWSPYGLGQRDRRPPPPTAPPPPTPSSMTDVDRR